MIESNGALAQADVVVIGAGPAGETVAGRCADGGLDVVRVGRELVGGECSYCLLSVPPSSSLALSVP